jgi:epoxyqueuosine reductase
VGGARPWGVADQLEHELQRAGVHAGLVAVGTCDARPFLEARKALEGRRAKGLHGSMQFTYRNPARSTDVTRTVGWARSLVVGALGYATDVPVAPNGGPQARVARYAVRSRYDELRHALEAMADVLASRGWRHQILADDNALVDRAAANRAGIGWFGKNANILVPGYGSWVVLGSIVTDADLANPSSPVADGCGACRRCLDSCPTGAIISPGVVDARRCLAWLVQADGVFEREHRVALGERIYGCDDCQEVCPVSRRPLDELARGVRDGDQHWVSLVRLLELGDEELLAEHGRWYIARRDPRYLRRNALVALGNVADPDDDQVAELLGGYLEHPDAMLRAHALWAVRRLGRDDLVGRLVGADAPEVESELSAAAPPRR